MSTIGRHTGLNLYIKISYLMVLFLVWIIIYVIVQCANTWVKYKIKDNLEMIIVIAVIAIATTVVTFNNCAEKSPGIIIITALCSLKL